MYTRGWCVIGRGGCIYPRNYLNLDTHTHTRTDTFTHAQMSLQAQLHTFPHTASVCVRMYPCTYKGGCQSPGAQIGRRSHEISPHLSFIKCCFLLI